MANNSPVIIAPSLLSADFSALATEVAEVEQAGARWLHLDVMDFHFVPNLTIGPLVIKPLAAASRMIMDVHLMIENPARWAPEFVKAGADLVTFHAEAVPREQWAEVLTGIRDLGVGAGISVKPGTPVVELEPVLAAADMVLVMSVEPGFGGQKWQGEMLAKASWLKESGYRGIVAMDGGLGVANARETAAMGVDMLVAGSAIFGEPDRQKAVASIRAEAEAGFQQRPTAWPHELPAAFLPANPD